ncbi:MAG: hypothetical protein P1S59_01805 [bacterium]|nr:hypothetical protein [bacterium]
MTAFPEDIKSYFWSYLKLVIKVVLAQPGRIVSHLRDAFRYYRPWKNSFTHEGSPLVHRIPWLPFACQDFIGRSIGPESVVFEFGSGGSTLYFLGRVKHLVSVEHDEDWYATVKSLLDEEEISNGEYYLEVPSPDPVRSDTDPCPLGYEDGGYPGMTFYDYASKIDAYEDSSFDLVVVDGRARNACLWHARGKLKPGGYLVLDNAEREGYRPGMKLIEKWPSREFFGILPYVRGFCKTVIWKKPHGDLRDDA